VRKVAEPRSTPPPTNKQAKCDGGVGKDACCSSDNKCGLGEGDCDGNADCQGDLVCREGLNNCRLFNPNAKADADCCIPGWMYQFASGVSVKSHSSNRVVLNTPRTMADCLYLYIACTDYQEPGWPGNKDKCMEICKWCPPPMVSSTPPPTPSTPPPTPPPSLPPSTPPTPPPIPGQAVLVKINFTTESCIGCEDRSDESEGLLFQIRGERDSNGPTSCRTEILDHEDRDDYGDGKQAVFQVDKKETDKRWLNTCYKAKIGSCKIVSKDPGINGINSTITWTGPGTWTPKYKRVDFSWDEGKVAVPQCPLSSCCISKSSLSSNETANLVNCEKVWENTGRVKTKNC